jgi:hypothetical protein
MDVDVEKPPVASTAGRAETPEEGEI